MAIPNQKDMSKAPVGSASMKHQLEVLTPFDMLPKNNDYTTN